MAASANQEDRWMPEQEDEWSGKDNDAACGAEREMRGVARSLARVSECDEIAPAMIAAGQTKLPGSFAPPRPATSAVAAAAGQQPCRRTERLLPLPPGRW